MDDLELQNCIVEELRFDPRVNASHIGVVADAGVVTLSGHVGSYAEKLAAESAVRRVKGVRALAEEIEVRLSDDMKTSDDEIARRVADILALDSLVPTDAIQITVQGGWVHLTGEVEWRFQRAAAESQVSKLSGIAGIVNNVTLRPRPPTPGIQYQIEEALRRNALLGDRAISVTVLESGHVILDGEVHGWEQCKAAEEIAWSVPGVGSVENRLTVG
jgi:osmotically-inducible protein OsmY